LSRAENKTLVLSVRTHYYGAERTTLLNFILVFVTFIVFCKRGIHFAGMNFSTWTDSSMEQEICGAEVLLMDAGKD